jgi:hypothetical protein
MIIATVIPCGFLGLRVFVAVCALRKTKGMILIMKKSLFIVLLAAFLLLSGCGGNDDVGGPGLHGNTAGNIGNGGIAAQSGDLIYYVNIENGDDVYSVNRARTDGTDAEKLCEERGLVGDLNVLEDWIYYTVTGVEAGALCRMRTDGTEREILASGDIYMNMTVVDNLIYYIDRALNICRMRTDGTGNRTFADTVGDVNSFNVVEEWVYFNTYPSDADEAAWTLRARTNNGKKREGSYPHNMRLFVIEDGRVYYTGWQSPRIYSEDIMTGDEPLTLKDGPSSGLNVADGWLYYINDNDQGSVYKMRTDGTEDQKLNDTDSRFVNLAGGWIYYRDVSAGALYRMRTDGSENQAVPPGNQAAGVSAGRADIIRNAVNDGVDFGTGGDGLLNPANGVYYGAYDHAASLDEQSRGAVSEREGIRRPILWRIMGDDGGVTLWSRYALDSAAFDNAGGNVYGDSDIRAFLESMAADAEVFREAERNGMTPADVVTGMYDGETGEEITGAAQGADYPATASGQLLYLPQGDFYDNAVYWSSKNTRDGAFRVADTEAALRDGGHVYYWLRSPASGYADRALGASQYGDIGIGRTGMALGVRPAFKLNPSSVVFASEIAAASADGQTPADDNYAVSEGGGKHFRLTVLNANLSPVDLRADGNLLAEGDAVSVQSGDGTVLTADGNTADGLAYKIVDGPEDARRIVGSDSGGQGELSVNALDADGSALAPGEYTLYIWAQKNNEIYSNEASEPQRFALRVTE